MYQYGDYVYHKHNWQNKHSIGLFLVYRPEKDTIVVESEGSLYEVASSNVRLASKIEVLNNYNGKIRDFLKQKDDCEIQIEICNETIENNEQKKAHIERDLPKVQIKLEALQVAYKLGGKKEVMKDVEVQIKRIEQNISGCNKSIRGCENNIIKVQDKRKNLQQMIDRANIAINLCEQKKVEYLQKIGEYDGLQ